MKNKFKLGLVAFVFLYPALGSSVSANESLQRNENIDYTPTRILGQGVQLKRINRGERISIQERLLKLKQRSQRQEIRVEVSDETEVDLTQLEQESTDSTSAVAPRIDIKETLKHYPHWEIPNSVLRTIIEDPHLSAYGSLAPDLLEKIQHNVTDPNLVDRGITNLLSVGVTHYGDSSSDRIFNINHSLFKYDGQIVQPGETFSFLETLGPVTKSDYKETKVILGGESVTGLGGGVCQTSTTMRRAAVFAGLPEGERKHHSFAVYHYGPLQGLDTAVWQPGLDYEFTNDTEAPIMIRVHVEDSHVMVFFYGKKDRDAVLLHQDQTGSISSGMTSTWNREIYKYGTQEPIVESWTARYKDYVDGEKKRR